jgi:hypothetical protein
MSDTPAAVLEIVRPGLATTVQDDPATAVSG